MHPRIFIFKKANVIRKNDSWRKIQTKPNLHLGTMRYRQLTNATKTAPQLSTITPRWLTHLLQWIPVEAGIYRLNRVNNTDDIQVACTQRDEATLPQTFVDYDPEPREYFLNGVSTVLDVHTRVADLYSSPHDQIKEQLRLTIETIKERQESELINNPEYGLLASVTDDQRISTLNYHLLQMILMICYVKSGKNRDFS